MPNRRRLASIVVTTFALAACGGSADSSQFNNAPAEAGPPVEDDAGVTLGVGPGDGGDGPCAPAALATSFAPTWKGPASSAAGACTDSQIQGFYDACMRSPVAPTTCSSFVSANGSCASCLQSDETDAKYGPVIWHASHTFFTINVAGCIANTQGDLSAHGCGAAWQAVVECEETACTQCYDPQTGDFARYAACEGNAQASECGKYRSAQGSACGNDAGTAALSACQPAPGSANAGENAYLLVAPLFCGENG